MKNHIKVSEKDLQKSVLDYLTRIGAVAVKFNNVGIYKPATGSYIPPRELGVSDVLCCYKGRFIAIELKSTGKKPTAAQYAFLARVIKAGGFSMWADNIDIVMRVFKSFD